MAPLGPWALSLALGAACLLHGATARPKDAMDDKSSDLFWGPYRPNLYFGVRPRTPKGLTAGLGWSRVETYADLQNQFRYTCEQNDGMAGYGWDEYDVRRGGVQTIHDRGNRLDVTTSFVKHGAGQWAVRVEGKPREEADEDGEPVRTMVVLFVSLEDDDSDGDSWLQVSGENTGDEDLRLGFPGDVVFRGASPALGPFRLTVSKGTGAHPESDGGSGDAFDGEYDLGRTVVQSLAVPAEHLWQAKAVLFQQVKQAVDEAVAKHGPEHLPPPWQVYVLPNRPGRGNLHVVQRVYEGPFAFDVVYGSGDDKGQDSAGLVSADDVARAINSTHAAFDAHFRAAFDLQAPFADDAHQRFAQSLFSNLLGGIGYFYGSSLTDRSYAAEYDEEGEGFWVEAAQARARHQEKAEGPYELFTSIPSRPFFPRGFLWDEGFHLLPIADWDAGVAREIVQSWFGLMDEDGWIAREQILGAEARAKVPAEFQVQYPHYANPPTLFLVVDKLAAAAAGEHEGGTNRAFLAALYPKLRRHYDWFRRTQYGDVRSYDRNAFSSREAYRWRGRTESHVLTSGLDDYPRPQPPHPGELHVDLLAWMGMMTRSLARVAALVGRDVDEQAELAAVGEAVARNLDDLHWSEAQGCYCDATIDDYEEHELVCHRGYVSLFPLLLGLLAPDDAKVGRLLALLGDEEELFSQHGLRSLSRKSPLYGTAENYWRSPVWININYLAVVALYNIATQDGPFQQQAADLYTRLRRNLVDTVFESWKETGFAWEQYNPETGKGQRTQHFTGWTSLVVKIMTMPEVAVAGGHARDEL